MKHYLNTIKSSVLFLLCLLFLVNTVHSEEFSFYGVSFDLPENWNIKLTSGKKDIQLTDPEEKLILIGSFLLKEEEKKMNLDELAEKFISGLRSSSKNFRIIESGKTDLNGIISFYIIFPIVTEKESINSKIYLVRTAKNFYSILSVPYNSNNFWDNIVIKTFKFD